MNTKTHVHEYARDTRPFASLPGGAGYLCRLCGFRIPEGAAQAAEAAGARFLDPVFVPLAVPYGCTAEETARRAKQYHGAAFGGLEVEQQADVRSLIRRGFLRFVDGRTPWLTVEAARVLVEAAEARNPDGSEAGGAAILAVEARTGRPFAD